MSLPDNSIDLIFTDPPYPREYLPCYGWLANEAARVLKPGGFLIAMAGGMYLNQIYRMFDVAGLTYFYEMVHVASKDAPYIWPRFVVAKAKSIIAYSKGDGLPRIKSVLNFYQPGGKDKRFHHWGQDVESARYYIDCFSAPDDLVLDPFIGGGTTAVACKLIGRRCIAFDLDLAALTTTKNRINESDIKTQIDMFQWAASQSQKGGVR
jgi:DNA modification methylase